MRLDPGASIVVLTGAGISAESGIRTFRDAGGLWEGHRMEDVATPEGFQRDPGLVQRFYDARRRQLSEVQPNAAHRALARLEQAWPGEVLVITQNVDDLHDRAGSLNLIHMHGELKKAQCQACGKIHPWEQDLGPAPPCPHCGRAALRPHIVWFGEMPLEMDRIFAALDTCALFLSIGTSGNVYPAAGFVGAVGAATHTLEINVEPSLTADAFLEHRQGKAGDLVPAFVDALLSPI